MEPSLKARNLKKTWNLNFAPGSVRKQEAFYHLAGINLLHAPAYFKPCIIIHKKKQQFEQIIFCTTKNSHSFPV